MVTRQMKSDVLIATVVRYVCVILRRVIRTQFTSNCNLADVVKRRIIGDSLICYVVNMPHIQYTIDIKRDAEA